MENEGKKNKTSSYEGKSYLTRQVAVKVGFGVVALVCLTGASLLIASGVYSVKAFPHTKVAGIEVSGKTKDEIRTALGDAFSRSEKKDLEFIYQKKNWSVPADDLKLTYNVEKTVDRVFSYTQVNSYPRRLWRLTKAIFGVKEINPVVTYDNEIVNKKLNKIAEDISTEEVNATAEVKKGKVNLIPEKYGTALDMTKIDRLISRSFYNIDKHNVNVAAVQVKPKVTKNETSQGLEEANKMLDAQIKLSYKSKKWTITKDKIGSWIQFDAVGVTDAGDVTAYEENAEVRGYRLKATLNEKRIRSYLSKIASGIDKPAKNAKVEIVNNKPRLVGKGEDGYGIDKDKGIADILPKIQMGEKASVVLIAAAIKPEVSAENIDEIGIKEVLGQARTLFYGSIPARVHNINNGARLLSGTLVRPGEEFSEGEALGDVDGENGFVQGLVIKENKTTPEYGGGLCQVSTTLFRAALRSGLRITERQNHSYRVPIYEKDDYGNVIGPGLDSTVYFPHPDLKFINDTGHYLLVTSEVIGYRITFKIWGTKDGRTAEIDGPHTLKVTPAPPTKNIKTNTLYVGQSKKLESAHPGGTAVAYYTVKKNGKVMFKQTFRSWYKPWAAVYMVGTRPRPVKK